MAPQTPLNCPWRGCQGSMALVGSRLTHSGFTGHRILSHVTRKDASSLHCKPWRHRQETRSDTARTQS